MLNVVFKFNSEYVYLNANMTDLTEKYFKETALNIAGLQPDPVPVQRGNRCEFTLVCSK